MTGLKEFVKAHTSKGFFEAVRNAKREWRISRKHRAALKKVGPFLHSPEKKLNLGCGPNPKPRWINIDLFRLSRRSPTRFAREVALCRREH